MIVASVMTAGAAQAPVQSAAAADQVQRGPAPGWAVASPLRDVPDSPAGPVFVRRFDTLIHLDGQGQRQYLGYRIRILHPNALQMGNVGLVWNPAAGAPVVHGVKIYRGTEVIDVLANTGFEVMRREDQLEASSLNGMLTAVLRIPDVRVGDELEVAMTVPGTDPTLRAANSGILRLPPDAPAGRFRFAIGWEGDRAPHLKISPDMQAAAHRSAQGVSFDFEDPTPPPAPQNAPTRYGWMRTVEYSSFEDWPSISRLFAPFYARAAALPAGAPLKEEARRIAAAYASPLDRARAALKLVQQQVRYVYVGMDGGNLMPASAGDTWQRRYGDCKAKTAMLLALLGELGIEAQAVLANNSGLDDGLDERLPSPRLFDHVLVRARIGGADYWLDGTLPAVAGPSAAPVIPYRWVLPLTAQGGTIERQPWRPAATPDDVTLYEIDAHEGFDQPARITSTTILRGPLGLAQQVQLSSLTQAQLLSGFRQSSGGGPWQAIDTVQWRYDERARASILTITGTGAVGWHDDGNGVRSLTLPGGGFNPPERRARAADQDQNAPYYTAPVFSCAVTTVRLPQASTPRQWSFNDSFDTRLFGRTYHRAMEMRDGTVRLVRGSRVEQPEIDAATARQDNDRIAAFDNSMAQIVYMPSGARRSRPAAQPVPTTAEIDWTADSVPCLGATTAAR